MTSDIAIIGLGCRLPGADSVAELWDVIESGATTFEAVTRADSERFGYSEAQIADSSFVPVRSALTDFDSFDAAYFGIPDHEAALMDPQHRVFLETVWSALEDSGHAGSNDCLRVGLFGSTSSSTYLNGPLADAGLWDVNDMNYSAMLANEKDFLCTRTSYTLGFTGPSVVIQSACSSSLLAVHAARQALLNDECDLAIAGGVSISLPHMGGYLHRTGSIASKAGTCRPFDKAADGTVKGNGAAVVVLRKAYEAEADRDHVYALIASSAVNNDGADKAGYPAPGVKGQSEVIAEAVRQSGIDAADIGYVEAHGTGTPLGDPIEVRALSKSRGSQLGAPCFLGSLKGNLGHLDAAAGVAGLIKAALVLAHQTVPPMAGFSEANAWLDLAAGGFQVPAEAVRLDGGITAAAVSAFGMGGTNVHAVLRRSVPPVPRLSSGGRVRVELSGATPESVRGGALKLSAFLTENPDVSVEDVAYTLAVGRRLDQFRTSAIVTSVAELLSALAQPVIEDSGSRRGEDTGADLGDLPDGRRIPLPGTVLERTRHWVDAEPRSRTLPRDAPATDEVTEDAVVLEMRRLLTNGDLALDDDFFDAGADSLLAIDLQAAIKDRFGVELEFGDMEQGRTARGITGRIRDRAQSVPQNQIPPQIAKGAPREVLPDASNLVHVSGTGERNVFLIHPAGGTTTCYVDLARHTHESLRIIGLSFPSEYIGRNLSMRDLSERYIAAIRNYQPEGPYIIGGYSFGGNLAVEIAIQLEDAGQAVERLILFDSHPPHAYTQADCPDDAYIEAFAELLQVMIPSVRFADGADLSTTVEDILAAVVEPVWPDSVRQELGQFFQIWQDNHGVLKRWTPDRKVQAPVLVLEASSPEPPEVLEKLAIAQTTVREWDRYIAGELTFIPVQGDHYSIFRTEVALKPMGNALTDALC